MPIGNKLMLLKEEQLAEHGSVNYPQLLEEWKAWVKASHLKRLLESQKKKGK
ncbi:MAG: hypothetical protein HY917_02645 [Candidatus Diapherotrites archaeon]|nr:hypothetical protein [Candidatus Diapherotrites archaeon]